jgi:ABC-type antimicrobial peptide transport system ATPase subunit
MSTKKRKREERQQREDTEVVALQKIAHIAKDLARLTNLKNQYKALVKQILEITEQPDTAVTLTEENTTQIIQNVTRWLQNINEIREASSNTRNEALKTLRTIDVLDDDALKGAALILTESETRLATLEGIEHRFYRIVRYTSTTTSIEKHTKEWLKRFLAQWAKTNKTIVTRQKQFKEMISSLRMDVLN